MLVGSPVSPLLVELVAGGDGRPELLLSAEHWTWRFWEVLEALGEVGDAGGASVGGYRVSGSADIEGSILMKTAFLVERVHTGTRRGRGIHCAELCETGPSWKWTMTPDISTTAGC